MFISAVNGWRYGEPRTRFHRLELRGVADISAGGTAPTDVIPGGEVY